MIDVPRRQARALQARGDRGLAQFQRRFDVGAILLGEGVVRLKPLRRSRKVTCLNLCVCKNRQKPVNVGESLLK